MLLILWIQLKWYYCLGYCVALQATFFSVLYCFQLYINLDIQSFLGCLSANVHLKCVRTLSQPANMAWPQQGPRHLWHRRKDRVCVILPLYLTAIFHCSLTFTSSLPRGQVSSSSRNFLPPLLSTAGVPMTLTQPQHHSAKSSVRLNAFYLYRLWLVLFLKQASMTSKQSHFLP